MAIHPLEAQLTGRILKTAAEVYENVLTTRPFLETNIRQNPAQLLELIHDIVKSLDNPRTIIQLNEKILPVAGAKLPPNLEEALQRSLRSNMESYTNNINALYDVMIDLTNPEAVRRGTERPLTESQLRNLILDRLRNMHSLSPDTLKTLAAFIGVPGEQYQALRESLPETPWIIPARKVYDRSLRKPRDSDIALIDLTGNDPFRLPVSLLNVAVQRAIPRLKLPNPRYGGKYTLQIPDLVLESALLERLMEDYVGTALHTTWRSPVSMHTLGELVGALRILQPALIDQFVNSPEGQQILRESSLPGVQHLIEDVKTRWRQGPVPGLSRYEPTHQAFKLGLENVRAVPNAPNLPAWMRRRLPAQKAEIIDPTVAADAIRTLNKMTLVAAAPELLRYGIDPMKANIAQVMRVLRSAMAMDSLSKPFALFDILFRGHIKNPEQYNLPEWKQSALPELLQLARSLDPRVESLPPFQELTAVARQLPSSTPKTPKP